MSRMFGKLGAALVGAGMLSTLPLAAQAATIGVALAEDTNPFYIAMKRGIEARAKELGHETRFVNVDKDVSKQVDGVLDLVAQKVDAILISPIDAVATGAAYEAAAKANIPIISIARHSNSPHQTLFVAMDEVQIGREIAAKMAAAIGNKGKVAMIAGPSGAATFRNLTQGFEEEMKKHSGISIVYKHEVPLTREMGLKHAEDILVAHPDIAGIYGANDEIALGAMQVVTTAGKGDKIFVSGMNGVPPAMKSVAAGELDMTVQLNPVAWGRLGVETVDNWLKGTRPKDRVFVAHKLITKDNAAASMPK